jgi:DTW domain-containing protein YfiP
MAFLIVVSVSFAIDEFPVMDEDAIEEYWIRKVEAHKKMREESFAEMEREYLEQFSEGSIDKELFSRFEKIATAQLRKMTRDAETLPHEKEAIHAVLDARWQKLEEMEKEKGHEEL